MRIKRKRTFYAEEFRKKVLAVYYGSEESIAQISQRFDVNIETVRSWVFRSNSERDKKSKFEGAKEHHRLDLLGKKFHQP